MSSMPDDIARRAAAALSGEFGPGLAAAVEARLQPGAAPRVFADPVTATIALAALLVSAGKAGWDIYRDVKKGAAPAPAPQVLERRLRIAIGEVPGVTTAQRDRAITVVVEEIVKTPEP